MLWGDLGGQGGGAQASGGHLVKHLSNEAAVLGVLFFTCLLASLLLILTATVFDNASVTCTCVQQHEVINLRSSRCLHNPTHHYSTRAAANSLCARHAQVYVSNQC